MNIDNAQIQAVMKDFKHYPKQVQDAIKMASKESASNIGRSAKITLGSGRYPYTNGELAQSIHVQQRSGGLLGVIVPPNGAVVGTRKPYAASVEMGSRPHIIRPRNKKFLAWQVRGGFMGTNTPLWVSRKTGRQIKDRKNALWAFVTMVNHPGNKPKPYLRPAADMEAPRYFETIKRLITKI